MTFNRDQFEQEKEHFGMLQAGDSELSDLARRFVVESDYYNYAYQWSWCGLPILQLPQDVLATQEIIHECQPTIVIETGVAWGGGVALYASCMDVYGGGTVIGIDLNLAESVIDTVSDIGFESSIELIRGSSTDTDVVARVLSLIGIDDRVMVVLDSNHSHEHVRKELDLYAPLVSVDQYCIVSDTIVELIPEQKHRPRPWGHGNNPMTAVREFLEMDVNFVSDEAIDSRLLMSFNPTGYLRRVS